MHRLEKKTKKKVYMDRRDESLPLKPNIKKKKKAKKDKEVEQMLQRPAQLTVYSVCALTLTAAEPRKWAAQVRWSLNEKLRISLEAPLFIFKASLPKMLTNHQSNKLML